MPKLFMSLVAFFIFVPLAKAGEWSASDATFRVTIPKGPVTYSGSATCIHTEDGESILLSCQHVLAHSTDDNANLHDRDGNKLCVVKCIYKDNQHDLAVLVAPITLKFAPLAEDSVPSDTVIWHRGFGSTNSVGVAKKGNDTNPELSFKGTSNSVNGDSGTGVFDAAGYVVAINLGKTLNDNCARGTAAGPIRRLLARAMPKLAERLKAKQPPKVTYVLADCVEQTVADGKGGTFKRFVLKQK